MLEQGRVARRLPVGLRCRCCLRRPLPSLHTPQSQVTGAYLGNAATEGRLGFFMSPLPPLPPPLLLLLLLLLLLQLSEEEEDEEDCDA